MNSNICSSRRVRCAVLTPAMRPPATASTVALGLRLTVMMASCSGRNSTASGCVSYCTMDESTASRSSSTNGQSTITSACPVSASRSTRDVSSSSSAYVTNSGFTCSSSSIQRRSSCVGATTLIQHPRTGASTLPVNGTFVPSAATSCDVL